MHPLSRKGPAMDAPIDFSDLAVFDEDIPEERAEAMIATVWARTRTLAPCLSEADVELNADQFENVKSVVRDVVLRWAELGTGVASSRTAGDYSESYNGGGSGGLFRPGEIRELQAVCSEVRRPTQRAYSVSLVGSTPTIQHALWCMRSFGESELCDCGAELSRDGQPLWRR